MGWFADKKAFFTARGTEAAEAPEHPDGDFSSLMETAASWLRGDRGPARAAVMKAITFVGLRGRTGGRQPAPRELRRRRGPFDFLAVSAAGERISYELFVLAKRQKGHPESAAATRGRPYTYVGIEVGAPPASSPRVPGGSSRRSPRSASPIRLMEGWAPERESSPPTRLASWSGRRARSIPLLGFRACDARFSRGGGPGAGRGPRVRWEGAVSSRMGLAPESRSPCPQRAEPEGARGGRESVPVRLTRSGHRDRNDGSSRRSHRRGEDRERTRACGKIRSFSALDSETRVALRAGVQ